MNISKTVKSTSVFRVFKVNLHLSSGVSAGKIWRQMNGLPKLQTAKGPLVDLPDYSFLDGRPTPLSVGQVKRQEVQKKLTVDAISGLKFLNRSKELINNIKNTKQANK